MVRSAYIRGMCPNIFVLRQGCGAGGSDFWFPLGGSGGRVPAERSGVRVRVSGLLWGCVARIDILRLFGIGVMYCNTRYDPKLG